MEKPVIKIENLVKRYKDLIALDHFNIEINKGEIFSLLGPNCSGKTTAINFILSLLSFDKGTIQVFGQEMRPDSYDLKTADWNYHAGCHCIQHSDRLRKYRLLLRSLHPG